MKLLVVGGGGREHAIVEQLSKSKYCPELYCAPGNAGISKLARCVPIKATDLDAIVEFSISETIDLVFVAPDDPLAQGLVNRLQEKNIRTFGPTSQAAIIEASKSFSKQFMEKYNIPTAKYRVFDDCDKAIEYIDELHPPIVVKTDGLALGKGVIIASSTSEAKEAVSSMLSGKAFGNSGMTVVIEEFLKGKELTVLAFTDGKTILPMPNSRDHKRALDNDEGLNTGGMGAICPGEILSNEYEQLLLETIFKPTIHAMGLEGREYKGVIYFGLMLTKEGPKVIEYNARFGDPEAQAILPLLQTDIIDIINAVIDGNLDKISIEWENKASCCVVMASGGYPTEYKTGFEITGLDRTNCRVYHAGTKFASDGSGRVLTSGGRVLGITGVADNMATAISIAYNNVEKINFTNKHYRTDIGKSR